MKAVTHRDGSRKAQVHTVYTKSGADAALKKAASLKLKESTAKQWVRTWNRNGGKTPARKAAPKAKPATKKVAKKK